MPLRSFSSLRRYVGSGDDWRQAVWNRWLVSYLTPREGEEGPDTEQQPANHDTASTEASSGVEEASADAPAPGDENVGQPQSAQEPAARRRPTDPPESAGVEQRQLAARARLDMLGRQLCGIEDVLDALAQRIQARELAERRTNQRMVELIERVVDAAERQSEALERSIATLERVERRLTRVDRWVRPSGMESIPPGPLAPFASGFSESIGIQNGVHTETSPASQRVPSMSGSLGDMSVATLLSMLELERRTGCLSIDGETDHVRFELLDGAVVGGAVSDRQEDPLEVLRTALCWRTGSFSFSHGPVMAGAYPPRSVGALLLEATHQNDEAVRISG